MGCVVGGVRKPPNGKPENGRDSEGYFDRLIKAKRKASTVVMPHCTKNPVKKIMRQGTFGISSDGSLVSTMENTLKRPLILTGLSRLNSSRPVIG